MTNLSNYSEAEQLIIKAALAKGETTVYLGECAVTGMSRYYVVNFW